MNKEIKGKIIWAIEYAKSNMDHIKELYDEYNIDAKEDHTWISSEDEADKLIAIISLENF
tara:strand:+ start:369 stop:548 length:180 start_codon:yes stop_codon:yes gene_type:complete